MKWLLRKYYSRKARKLADQVTSCCEYISHALHTGQECSDAIERRDKLYADLMNCINNINTNNKTI